MVSEMLPQVIQLQDMASVHNRIMLEKGKCWMKPPFSVTFIFLFFVCEQVSVCTCAHVDEYGVCICVWAGMCTTARAGCQVLHHILSPYAVTIYCHHMLSRSTIYLETGSLHWNPCFPPSHPPLSQFVCSELHEKSYEWNQSRLGKGTIRRRNSREPLRSEAHVWRRIVPAQNIALTISVQF